MKTKFIPFLGALLLFAVPCFGGENAVSELPLAEIQPATYTYRVSIATHQWTEFPGSTITPLKSREGVWVAARASNSANMQFCVTASTVTNAPNFFPLAPETTMQIDGTITKGVGPSEIRVPEWMKLWVLSLHTSAEELCGREYRRK